MKALRKGKYVLPQDLFVSDIPGERFDPKTNLKGDRAYDQIAFKAQENELRFLSAGVFDFRSAVFRDRDYLTYRDSMPAKNRELNADGAPVSEDKDRAYYKNIWRSFQMSDHLPLWVELEIDFSDAYLSRFKT